MGIQMNKKISEKKLLHSLGWLIENEMPLVGRLKYNLLEENSAPQITENNIEVRDEIFREICSNEFKPIPNIDILSEGEADDILISEFDRYGLPLRTVINTQTGLVRSDPYYSEKWLEIFYSKYYRRLYTNNLDNSFSSIFREQIGRGEYYYNFMHDYLSPTESILEIGCGMGGILVPFKIKGYEIKGVDIGEEFVSYGNRFNLNLSNNSIDDLVKDGQKYSLIILSHFIEHVPDLTTLFQNLKKILTTNGKVFIAVPGLKMIHQTYQSNIHIYLQNAHCWSFTQSTLSALLSKMNFKVIACDENINCLCELTDEALKQFDNSNEADEIILYINQIEANYAKIKTVSKPTLFKRIKNKIQSFVKLL